MKYEQFRALLWLRWRLRANQLTRGGTANLIVLAILYVLVVALAVALFVGGLLAGLFALGAVSSGVILYVWDGIVVAMLFLWMVGLLADLQRSDPLILDKVLHLPVSPAGAFTINYLSSLVNLTLILFLAAAGGLGLGLLCSRGPVQLVLFPLVAAFVLALTALTYQFQGWLASLMANPRKRRTIIVIATMIFVLAAQVPNLINLATMRTRRAQKPFMKLHAEHAELGRQLAAGKLTPQQYQQRMEEANREHKRRTEEENRQGNEQTEWTARLINLAFPPGWLPLGAAAAAEGDLLPALMGTLGLGLIGSVSLWRAYRTTIRLYTGHYTAGDRSAQPAVTAPAVPAEVTGDPTSTRFLEKKLPWVSEQASAVALGSFVSFLRAPESKMMMLTPLIFACIGASMMLSSSNAPPVPVRPLMVFGASAMVMMSLLQMVGNQFGFDRAGFRVYVLGPTPRREVLLGKNLALAPLPLAWAALILIVLQCIYPMRIDHFLAVLPQVAAMYLLFCVVGNWLSIFAPIPIAQGSFKPASSRLVPVLLNMLAFFLFPILFAPLLLPLGIEYAAADLGDLQGWPIALALSLVLCAVVTLVYWAMLGWQGQTLHRREQQILKVVTSKE